MTRHKLSSAKPKSFNFAAAALAISLPFVVAPTGPASAQTTERVSLASDGTQSNGHSGAVMISADGRYVAFDSEANNLVPSDTNGNSDVFVRDRQTGMVERVSVASDNTQSNNFSGLGGFSADGRYVVFTSLAGNLVPGDSNGNWDVFAHDRQTGQTELISVASDGTQLGGAGGGFITPDGRYVVFRTFPSLIDPSSLNIYVRDRQTSNTQLVSVTMSGAPVPFGAHSLRFAISADGRYVAFTSFGDTLVPNDTSGLDAFVRDLVTGQTERISVTPAGSQSNGSTYGAISISDDGRYVAFGSDASDLVPGDTNGYPDIFMRDRQTGVTSRMSIASDGSQLSVNDTWESTISPDGRYVAFQSLASNLVASDTNNTWDVFLRDRSTSLTERISLAVDGSQGNDFSFVVQGGISADNRYLAFLSNASNLVSNDTNNKKDDFVRDRGPQILYSFIGFNQPVDNLPISNSAKAGSTIPVKWLLTDGDGNYVSDLSVVELLQHAPIACDAQDLELVDPIEAYAPGSSGLQYDPLTNEFIFPWKTAKSQKNTCAVFALTLTDGQQQFARFWLK